MKYIFHSLFNLDKLNISQGIVIVLISSSPYLILQIADIPHSCVIQEVYHNYKRT